MKTVAHHTTFIPIEFNIQIFISLWFPWLSNGYLIVEVLDYSVLPCYTRYS